MNFIQAIDEVTGVSSTITRDEGTYDYSRKWEVDDENYAIEMKMSKSNGETFILVRVKMIS
ncbi:MAG: hypothetical protein PHD56_03735 [Anaerostipes sp.]|nr:hypothetical protein [Anaerostipes sp.]